MQEQHIISLSLFYRIPLYNTVPGTQSWKTILWSSTSDSLLLGTMSSYTFHISPHLGSEVPTVPCLNCFQRYQDSKQPWKTETTSLFREKGWHVYSLEYKDMFLAVKGQTCCPACWKRPKSLSSGFCNASHCECMGPFLSPGAAGAQGPGAGMLTLWTLSLLCVDKLPYLLAS